MFTCPITNTELPWIDSISNDISNQGTGLQISKELHQICLILIFMLGLSQGIGEEEISKILSSNLKTFDSFENTIGVILNKIIKYTSNLITEDKD